MKYYTVLLFLVIGLNIIDAISVLNESVFDNSVIRGSNETIIKDKISSSNESEEKGDMFNVIIDSTDKTQLDYEKTLDIVMENIDNPTDQLDLEELANNYEINLQESSDVTIDDIIPPRDADYNYNDVINRDPNEIMDTAAGFVPIPIFKRRQKLRKQVAARRRFRQPYPYRRLYYFYPYYNYYRSRPFRFYY